MANYLDSEGNLRMKTKFGLLFALTLVLGATTVEANYTIAGGFTGTADYLSGAKEFFLTSSALDVDRVVGTIELYATTAQPVPYDAGSDSYVVTYKGAASYSISLFDNNGLQLFSYSGSGSVADFTVANRLRDKTTSTSYDIATATGGTLGGNYLPVSFSASLSTMPTDRFSLLFRNPVTGKIGSISGAFLTSTVTVTPAVTYADPPLPTPLPASLPLLGSGLAGLGFLWRRKFSQL